MKILVTGGAGYIGSHTVRQLVAAGHEVVVLDNLAYGHREAIVDGEVVLVEGDVGDAAVVEALFGAHGIEGVMHFAAFIEVGESVRDPLKYYRNNFAAPLNLLAVMREHGCRRFIFSSTCATYGMPEKVPIPEGHPQRPINPYGRSKHMLEQALRDCDRAWGLKSVNLRYFNASGAALDGRIGEDHDPETHLIPLVLMAIRGQREKLRVFGTDYDTPDGTCIRDYIHVEDLAAAHRLAIEAVEPGVATAFNVGTGTGYSVRRIIETVRRVTGREIPVREGPRRPGDPPVLVADADLIRRRLGWRAKWTEVGDIITSAWRWHEVRPDGFVDG